MTNTTSDALPPPLTIEQNTVKGSDLDAMIPGGIAMLPIMLSSLLPAMSETETDTPDPDSFMARMERAIESKQPVALGVQIGEKAWTVLITP